MNVYTKKKQKQKTNLWLPKVRMCSVTQLCLTLCDPWTIACQAPLSMAFSRQEYWSGLPFPSPGHLPEPGIEPASPALAAGFFTTAPPGKPKGGAGCVWAANYRLYGTSSYKLLNIKQISNKDLLYSTGNNIQYLVITNNAIK